MSPFILTQVPNLSLNNQIRTGLEILSWKNIEAGSIDPGLKQSMIRNCESFCELFCESLPNIPFKAHNFVNSFWMYKTPDYSFS